MISDETAVRDFYGVFFDLFPGWYKKRCVERFTEDLEMTRTNTPNPYRSQA